CLARLGLRSESVGDITKAAAGDSLSLVELAEYYGSIGAIERGEFRGFQQLGRGLRVSECMSNASLRHNLLREIPGDKVVGEVCGLSVEPDLDSAAALLELGGHPHILARGA